MNHMFLSPYLGLILGKLVELIRFVHAFHHCDVIGHIRPNCFLLRQKSKFAPRTPSRKPSNPKTAHVCHHCGISRHTRMNATWIFGPVVIPSPKNSSL